MPALPGATDQTRTRLPATSPEPAPFPQDGNSEGDADSERVPPTNAEKPPATVYGPLDRVA